MHKQDVAKGSCSFKNEGLARKVYLWETHGERNYKKSKSPRDIFLPFRNRNSFQSFLHITLKTNIKFVNLYLKSNITDKP